MSHTVRLASPAGIGVPGAWFVIHRAACGKAGWWSARKWSYLSDGSYTERRA